MSDDEAWPNPFEHPPTEMEGELGNYPASESESTLSDQSASEHVTVGQYAAEHLGGHLGYFLTRTESGHQCIECRQPFKRVSRILAHWEKKHYGALQGLVKLHRLGVLEEETEDSDLMDTEPLGEDPILVAAYNMVAAPSTDVTITRETIHAPLMDTPGDFMDEDILSNGNQTEKYPGTITAEGEILFEYNRTRPLLENPWHPFASGHEFKLAGWFLEASVGKTHINSYFNRGLGPQPMTEGSFTSAHQFRKLLATMTLNPRYPDSAMSQWRDGIVNFPEGGKEHPVTFHYRDLEPVIQNFFEEPWYQDKLVFMPEKSIRSDGVKVYTEMHTGEWWWNTQVKIDEEIGLGRFVIPIIFGSDETHLTNFSGDKSIWPLYMSIGNLPSKFRDKPTTHCWELVALLPLPPKHASTSQKILAAAREDFAQSIQAALAIILEPLKHLYRTGIQVAAPDGTYKRGHPVVGAWLADYIEYLKLFNLKTKACPVCEVESHKLQDCTTAALGGGRNAPLRDSTLYSQAAFHFAHAKAEIQWDSLGECMLDDERKEKLLATLSELEGWFVKWSAKPLQTALWELPHVTPLTIWKPDMLHTVYLGILKHLTAWIHDFLRAHRRLEHLDWLWKNVPKYPGLVVPSKAYREIKQWNGKEMRHAGKFLLAVLDAVLYNPSSPEEREQFASILNCTRTLVDFHLICQQPLHDKESLRLMDTYLKDFHAVKDIFKRFTKIKVGATAGKKAVKAYYQRLFGCVPEASDPRIKKLTTAQKEERELLREQAAMGVCDFNIPKLHLCSHFSEVVSLFGSLLGWSTEVTEALHKLLKEFYQSSNRGPNYLEQIVIQWMHTRAYEMRRLNLQRILNDKALKLPASWEDDVREHLMLFETAEEGRWRAKENRACVEDSGIAVEPSKPKSPPAPSRNTTHTTSGFVRSFVGVVADTKQSIALKQTTRTLGDVQRTYNLPNLARDTLRYILTLSEAYSVLSTVPADLIHALPTRCSLSVEVTNEDRLQFQENGEDGELETRKIARCTGPFVYRKEQRSDAVYFLEDGGLATAAHMQYRRKREGILSGTRVGILRCLFSLEVPPVDSEALMSTAWLGAWVYRSNCRKLVEAGGVQHLLAYIELLDVDNVGDSESASKLARLSRKVVPRYRVVPITSIVRIAHIIPIPPDLWRSTTVSGRYILNNRVDLATWYQFY